jgi:outer membrane immunogenic protein
MKSLKTALLGATILVSAGAISGANAADVYSRGSIKDTGPVDYRPAITWTGFYFGANIGTTFNEEVTIEDVTFEDDDDNELLAGLHLGYNWQKSSNLVLGIEGDVSFGDDIEYLASLRGRVGLAAGPTLFYATGGVALLGFEDDFGDDSEDFTGWVAGLGVEHKIRDNLSVGLEGLYYAFEEEIENTDVELDFWTVRARLTYHLGSHREELK